ncbi:putative membrane protein [Pseudoloma neurophilia]|uniref:Putative membrane protein n=1 Tax=Pseudoloma neurophilia TaxID=146866 RepID=A0A0R0M5L9_9MICR|nr:putative membrane protein [Pseudoloma neurophilia]
MYDRFERDNFHSKLPKTWKIPNKTSTSLVKYEKLSDVSNIIQKKRRWLDYFTMDKITTLTFFLLRMFFIGISVYISLQIFFTIRNDIRIRVDEEFSKLSYLIEESKYKFLINKCGIVDIPGMRRDCMEWKKNMKKTRSDIQVMGLVMDCFGHIIDRFLEQISWKFFITISCILLIYILFYRRACN